MVLQTVSFSSPWMTVSYQFSLIIQATTARQNNWECVSDYLQVMTQVQDIGEFLRLLELSYTAHVSIVQGLEEKRELFHIKWREQSSAVQRKKELFNYSEKKKNHRWFITFLFFCPYTSQTRSCSAGKFSVCSTGSCWRQCREKMFPEQLLTRVTNGSNMAGISHIIYIFPNSVFGNGHNHKFRCGSLFQEVIAKND